MLPDSPQPKTGRTCARCGLVFFSEKFDAMCPACLITNSLDGEDIDDGPAFWEDAPEKATAPARTFSHFELLDELGRGGMGVVYRARDLNTERIIALKVLQAHHLDVPDLVQRFRSEVRAVSSLDHAYVLPIHEVGEHEGIPFFSMKLTTGGSLAQSIGNYAGKPKEAAQLLAKVSRGVQHAHERGILHRDLKPGNILLDASGEPYVCDFGLAKWIEDDQKLTVTAAVLGTPHYIAPEQALGSKALTTAVDIYSLGAILYELLTGRPPFVGATVLETLVASQDKAPDRPSSLAKNVPPDLETICLKALEHSPSARYASAGSFATDLENWLAGRPINARPVNAAGQLWRWAKRNPLPALLVAALIGTVVTIAIGSTAAAVRIDHARERAVAAEAEAIKERTNAEFRLYQSQLAQARASRQTGRPGQRSDALAAIYEAAKTKKTLELRNEAIATLGLLDLHIVRKLHIRKSPIKQPTAFSGNLRELFVADLDGAIVSIPLIKGARTVSLPSLGDRAIALFPSGSKYLCVRYDSNYTIVWDLTTQRIALRLEKQPIPSLLPWQLFDCCFSPDESLFACAQDNGKVHVYDTNSWTIRVELDAIKYTTLLSISPDNERILALHRDDPTAQLLSLDKPSNTPLSIRLPADARHGCWSPDGKLLAIGCRDFSIYIVNAKKGIILHSFLGHRQDVTQVIFSNQGDLLASTSRDRTIRLWDMRTKTEQISFSGIGVEPVILFSHDDQTISATDFGTEAVLLRLQTEMRTPIVSSPPKQNESATLVSSIDYSPDGKRIATATFRTIDVWDAVSGWHISSFDILGNKEKTIRFGERSDILYVASKGSEICQYRLVETEGEVEATKINTITNTSEFIFGSRTIGKEEIFCVTSSKAGAAKVIDISTGATLLELNNQAEVWDMIVDPKRGWAATSYSARGADHVQIWSYPDGKPLALLPTGSAGVLCTDSKYRWLFTNGTAGGIVWNTETWEQGPNIPKSIDARQIVTAVYSPDGTILAVSLEEKVYLLRSTDGEMIACLESKILSSPNYRLCFSPDGSKLATQGEDNSIRIWDLKVVRDELSKVGLDW